MPAKLTTENFIQKANIIHNNTYDYSQVKYVGSKNEITIVCKEHGQFLQKPNNHLNGQGCPICSRSDINKFIIHANEIHNNKYIYSKTIYQNAKTKVIITCPVHGDFLQIPDSHLSGSGCPECGKYSNNKKLTQNEYVCRARAVHGNMYDYSLTMYCGTEKKVDIICPIHGKFTQIASTHLQGSGCPKCYGNIRLSTQVFIDRANMVHEYWYDYSKVNYINATTKVSIVCPIHGEFQQNPNSHLQGCCCPKCNMSKGESKISKVLSKMGVSYKFQFSFKECKDVSVLPFDFYVPSKNILIEYDGIQHFKPVDVFDGIVGYEIRKYHDNIKNNYAIDNNITLIRIAYTDYKNINTILFEKLK